MSAVRIGPTAVTRGPRALFVEDDKQNEWLCASPAQLEAYNGFTNHGAGLRPVTFEESRGGQTFTYEVKEEKNMITLTNKNTKKVRRMVFCSEQDLPEHDCLIEGSASKLVSQGDRFIKSMNFKHAEDRCNNKPPFNAYSGEAEEQYRDRIKMIMAEYKSDIESLRRSVKRGQWYERISYMPKSLEDMEYKITSFSVPSD